MSDAEGPLSHVLPAEANLGDAADRIETAYCPLLALVDVDGHVVGVVREEQVRLGLTGEGRVHHPLASHARPPEEFPEIPLDENFRPLAYRPPTPVLHRALVMAGGRGLRLHPLTETRPKPLLKIGGDPLLHRVLRQLAAVGIQKVFVSVHYLGEQIRDSVGDGKDFGLDVLYLEESRPLGTAGAIGLLPAQNQTLLVMNGDILTDINLPSFLAWHTRHGNSVTVATHLHEVEVPFGLAHIEEQRLDSLEEKPTLRLPVNAGIYLFEPEILNEVPANEPFDMVTWLNRLAESKQIGHFPIVENWNDIGSPEEYRRLTEE